MGFADSAAMLDVKHGIMLVVASAVLHDRVKRGQRLDIFVVFNLIKRDAVTASGVHDRPVRHDFTFPEKPVEISAVLAHPGLFVGRHRGEEIRARGYVFAEIELHRRLPDGDWALAVFDGQQKFTLECRWIKGYYHFRSKSLPK